MGKADQKPLISVIVPVYKVEQYLHECVDSILAQTYTNLEIILVDDGSPDNCPAICDEYAEKDSRIKVIHKENGGLSDARNTGIDVSKGHYLFFVDSDDYVHPHTIQQLLMHINEGSASAADVTRIPYNNTDITTKSCKTKKLVCTKIHKFRGGWYVCGILYNKEIIDKNHLRFRRELKALEDVEFNTKYFITIGNIICVSGIPYYYRYNPKSVSNNIQPRKWIDCWMKVKFFVFDYCSDETLSKKQIIQIKRSLFYIQKNIVSECVWANINKKEYFEIESDYYHSNLVCLTKIKKVYNRKKDLAISKLMFIILSCDYQLKKLKSSLRKRIFK